MEAIETVNGGMHLPSRGPVLAADESPDISALAAALAKAQGAIRNAAKDSENPHFRSKYADLAAIWDACRAPLSANGLAVMQRVRTTESSVILNTMLVHSSGQWVRDTLEFPVAQRTPQAYGSAVTYARRYALAALVGVAADEDDDGNAASVGHQSQRHERQEKPAKEAKKAPPTPPPEAKPEPKQPPALRARIVALYKTATARGSSEDSFKAWVKQWIGRDVKSTEWTEAEVAKLEEIAKLPPAEAAAPSAPRNPQKPEGCDHEWDLTTGICGKCGLGEPPDEPGSNG